MRHHRWPGSELKIHWEKASAITVSTGLCRPVVRNSFLSAAYRAGCRSPIAVCGVFCGRRKKLRQAGRGPEANCDSDFSRCRDFFRPPFRPRRMQSQGRADFFGVDPKKGAAGWESRKDGIRKRLGFCPGPESRADRPFFGVHPKKIPFSRPKKPKKSVCQAILDCRFWIGI